MIPLKLGRDLDTGESVYVPRTSFDTHWHMIGSTGAGKTTALLCLLFALLCDGVRQSCVFVIDRMGGLTHSLQRWIASERHCPEHVRRRYVCIEASREDYVVPFNPLLYTSEANEYYQVERAVDAVLRAWESQDVSVMARLRRWMFNAFLAAARLGYTIASCKFLLHPGSDEHEGFLRQLPMGLQQEWGEILHARSGQEAIRILDSTRNRLGPYFDSSILRRVFGSTRNHLDIEKFIRDRNVVLINVSPGENQLSGHLGKTYGSLVLNQIFSTARYLAAVGRPAVDTCVVLDEFQDYLTPDIYECIPIVRQMGIKLILANQSFSQLVRGDLDLNGIIWQARSRMMFANDADDADRLAHEVATLAWDPYTIKHQVVTQKQRVAGYRKEWLNSQSQASSSVDTWKRQQSQSRSDSRAATRVPDSTDMVYRDTSGDGYTWGNTTGGSAGNTSTTGQSQSLVPIHEDVEEVTNVTFQSFDEFRTIKAREIRQLHTGQPLVKFVNDPKVYHVAVDRPAIPDSRRLQDALAALTERNLNSGLFVPASEIDREAEELRQRLLRPPNERLGSMGRSRPAVMEGPTVPNVDSSQPTGEYLFEDG